MNGNSNVRLPNGAAPTPPLNGTADKPNAIRDHAGRFLQGNQVAKGRKKPFASRVTANRAALLSAIGPSDIRMIAARLLEDALEGNGPVRVSAAREILTRVCGDKATEMEADHQLAEQATLMQTAAVLLVRKHLLPHQMGAYELDIKKLIEADERELRRFVAEGTAAARATLPAPITG